MFATLRAVVLSLACLCLGESTQIGSLSVTRSSLFGYTVEGHTLDADEAAAVLAHAAALADAKPQGAPHADLLRGPVESFPGSGRWSETWRAGDAANRRIAALRRALSDVRQDTTRSRGFTANRATVEVRYAVPRGALVPEIERAS